MQSATLRGAVPRINLAKDVSDADGRQVRVNFGKYPGSPAGQHPAGVICGMQLVTRWRPGPCFMPLKARFVRF